MDIYNTKALYQKIFGQIENCSGMILIEGRKQQVVTVRSKFHIVEGFHKERIFKLINKTGNCLISQIGRQGTFESILMPVGESKYELQLDGFKLLKDNVPYE